MRSELANAHAAPEHGDEDIEPDAGMVRGDRKYAFNLTEVRFPLYSLKHFPSNCFLSNRPTVASKSSGVVLLGDVLS
jgi:hypothetical protein